jgi:hypothetical protein
MIYLGTVTLEPDESVAFAIPADLDAATIAAAIDRANLERAEAVAEESRKLREIFLGGESHDQAR